MNRAASSRSQRRANGSDAQPLGVEKSVSPGRRVWLRFKRNRLGYWSLVIFVTAFVISLLGPMWSNDKPIVVRYQGHYYFPLVKTYAKTTFGGDFPTPADYLDPYVRDRFSAPGNFAVYPPNHYYYDTLNYFSKASNPAPPSRENWLGTDDRGRDVFARLVYGFRVSVIFALVLTAIGTVLGVLAGAVQGYFGGRVDITGQRLIEIWSALPELYLLIIFASIFEPSLIRG
ncbi:Oligopeptide transport system permease protein OppC [Candidatus Burkholderia verschuerenii]|uniref:Oligopeptide transport system permease protein OppC n=1 Tax=Candidatus Burkholderia verschuerenii TaxID=242163 RepID=A0A0L0M4K5_9BURK|nr:Oligopeptide transport system permease protein OppC [Candidatus Burkholderia verschuerenii]